MEWATALLAKLKARLSFGSLTLKLTAAFLVVGLTGAALVAVFVGLRTRQEFNRFVLDRWQADVVSDLAGYYERHGSWAGLQANLAGEILARHRWRWPARPPVAVANAEGVVVLGDWRHRAGERVPRPQLAAAVPVRVEGQTVGYVLFGPRFGRLPLVPSPEARFLARVGQAIRLGALAASAVALLLGILLARTITRPVRLLTEATQVVAQGELGHQVEVSSEDELGDLARSFNRMSADLARASQQRRQMTADIAHDLRTPMTVLLGYTEGLAEGKFEPTAEIFASMHQEARHLKRLIDDLHTLSLADAGELVLARERCRPFLLLERAVVAHRPLAEEQGITLHLEATADLPAVEVDQERMAQVLGNLISNAVRHTPAGGRITLSAGVADDGKTVLLHVADTGEGIAPQDLPHIFDRHYRSDRARRRTDSSSGLGLAIARSLVEAHGGRIGVESEPGRGAQFTIRLPAAGVHHAP